MSDLNEKLMKDMQWRKGLGIAYFNGLNAAIEFAKINGMSGVMDPKKFVTDWRDFFIEEYKKYYLEVISQVGTNFVASETIAVIQKAKTVEELKAVWLGLSADERANNEILKVKNQLKKKLSNEKA